MNTLIVSSSSSDPIALQLRGLVRSFTDVESSTLSFANLERGIPEHVELAMLVLPGDVDAGLDVLRRMRGAIHGQVMAVGRAHDSKVILRALQNGADYFLNQDELET